MAKQTKTIAFRLHDALEARLAADAAERQVSVGEYVRQIVINHLSGDTKKLFDAMSAVGNCVGKLELQLRTVAMELLINAGHAEPDEALDWVRKQLGPIDLK